MKSNFVSYVCLRTDADATLKCGHAARAAIDDNDLLDEADVEHASAKKLIAQIEDGSPNEDKWSTKVTVLGEYINHHVKEGQTELFQKVRKTDLDLKMLGEDLPARKQELFKQM